MVIQEVTLPVRHYRSAPTKINDFKEKSVPKRSEKINDFENQKFNQSRVAL
jgi:hypothetical protein